MPTGAKISAASSSAGARSSLPPAHATPSSRAKPVRRGVARPRERERLASLETCELRDDVRSGAETENAEACGVAGHAQRAIADQPRAHPRRELGIGVSAGQRERVACVGDGVFRVAAVDRVAGEARRVAEVFASARAIRAHTTGVAEPRHADAHADAKRCHAGAQRRHDTDNLVAGYQRQLGIGQLAIDDVQIGAADTAGLHLDQDLAGAGRRRGQRRRFERRAG